MTGTAAEARGVAVIGAGQAGLATGYHLKRAGLDFTIVADDERVGDPWRRRWDSLRLFTPAFYNGLPGMDFPADDPDHLPRKDEVADFLEAYARAFELPVRLRTRVERLRPEGGGWRLETAGGPVRAEAVVVATGAYHHPKLPPFADELGDDVFTTHSSGYRNPERLPGGDVLVVGAGNSGTQIATEIAEARPRRAVRLAGPDTGRLPRRLLGLDVYRWLGPTLLRLPRGSFLGRRLHRKTAGGGDPIFRPVFERMEAAGVERVDRIAGVERGRPVTARGRRIDAPTVIWATGFEHDFSWIEADAFDADGRPRHRRGVASGAPGLYFVGLRWLHTLSSSLIGGVGRDAAYLVERIREYRSSTGSGYGGSGPEPSTP